MSTTFMPSLTLYEHKESVCCHKVALTLAEKNIECRIVNVSLEDSEQKQPWFLAINPQGKVPALVDDGRTVLESSIIIEYLDDKYPSLPLMPQDPYWRARRRFWARWIDDEMHSPHISTISFVIAFGNIFRKRMDTEEKLTAYLNAIPDEKKRDHAESMFRSGLDSAKMRRSLRAYDGFLSAMETELEHSRWLAGDAFSLADIDVIPYIWRLSSLQLDLMWEHRPAVTDWLARLTARPSFKTAIVDQALPDWIETMRSTGIEARSVLSPIIAGFRNDTAGAGDR